MQLATRRLLGVKLAVAVTVALTACSQAEQTTESAPLAQIASGDETAPAENGIDQLPAEEVLEKVVANLERAGSFRVSGTTLKDSTIDITFKVGEGSVGTVTTGSEVELIASDDVVYITSDRETLAEVIDADIDDTIAGKWIRLSPDESEDSDYRIFADASSFVDAVLGLPVEAGPTSVKEVDGVPAVGLTLADSGGMLWVAAEGKPLPVRFEEKGASGNAGVLTFNDFGADVEIKAPKDSNVIDPAELPKDDEDSDGGE
ncbi:hypothetical protein [Phytoactinopolyspora halotolerans]|uniref:LppX_LprAFG lipoprotein n=1 Tax=Phytoactinopolyspora halotolerans TaxID=1981512 RepID=A0A6L9SI52_9ACTN|nr:hypothetical protein [Phytoactinopolyspora halotolerans]NEE04112.1 hypothetical protein [Phytoactinopolyspora halotolerans]